jgi:hypothetical protein
MLSRFLRKNERDDVRPSGAKKLPSRDSAAQARAASFESLGRRR